MQALPTLRRREADTTSYVADYLTRSVRRASGFVLVGNPEVGNGTTLLRGFALQDDAALLATLKAVTTKAPFRHMVTPGGFRMSVAMTNCGALGLGNGQSRLSLRRHRSSDW